MSSKNITVVNNAIKNYNVLLTFSEIQLGTGELYKDAFPVAWKVFKLAGGNGQKVSRSFSPEFFAFISERSSGNIVCAADVQPIKLSQIIDGKSVEGFQKFDGPAKDDGTSNRISLKNTGAELLDLGIMDGNKNPMFVQKNVQGNLAAVFVPKFTVHVYLSTNYVENEIIKSEVSGFVNTSFDLTTVPNGVTFTIDDSNGSGPVVVTGKQDV
eukprot:TRINITY_DN6750_c0_g1_i2.p1 TRINITY_DN6750_c0_g1~~TRINITY_DN6750_c0_g1_i2.p1  ORF type:complete len:212 (-),score=63.37 TRINITY_DN6750_c0_g1_i2:80-715(-)